MPIAKHRKTPWYNADAPVTHHVRHVTNNIGGLVTWTRRETRDENGGSSWLGSLPVDASSNSLRDGEAAWQMLPAKLVGDEERRVGLRPQKGPAADTVSFIKSKWNNRTSGSFQPCHDRPIWWYDSCSRTSPASQYRAEEVPMIHYRTIALSCGAARWWCLAIIAGCASASTEEESLRHHIDARTSRDVSAATVGRDGSEASPSRDGAVAYDAAVDGQSHFDVVRREDAAALDPDASDDSDDAGKPVERPDVRDLELPDVARTEDVPDIRSEPDTGVVRERSCDTIVSYVPDNPAQTVELAGEWRWAERTPMHAMGERFETSLDLAPGLHCYKLIVDGEWGLDPSNAYRAYCDGTENSGLRVPDRRRPLLTLVGPARATPDGGFSARVDYHSGCGGAHPAVVEASLLADFDVRPLQAMWDPDSWSLQIAVTGLAPGKYTIQVEATDRNGRSAERLLLPFWIEPVPFAWQDALIYMIMTDRFVDGDPSNDPEPTPDASPTADWFGGDLSGVRRTIESGYFEDLGVRALWLTPFNTGAYGVFADADERHLIAGYHGYWPIEPRTVDPRLGTAEDLRALVTAAHQRGIRVLMDLVVNHVHQDHVYVPLHANGFRNGCVCGTDGCGWDEHRLDCVFAPYMPDVDWRDRTLSEQLLSDALWWLETLDLDGFRIDAVKHVEDLAIFNLGTRVAETFEQAGTDYYLDGETAVGWSGDDLENNLPQYTLVNRYLGPAGLDGQFDFVLHHAVAERVFVRGERGYLHLDYWTEQSQQLYSPNAIMTPFLGSHDSSRFISLVDYQSRDPEAPRREWPEEGLPQPPATPEPYSRARPAYCIAGCSPSRGRP